MQRGKNFVALKRLLTKLLTDKIAGAGDRAHKKRLNEPIRIRDMQFIVRLINTAAQRRNSSSALFLHVLEPLEFITTMEDSQPDAASPSGWSTTTRSVTCTVGVSATGNVSPYSRSKETREVEVPSSREYTRFLEDCLLRIEAITPARSELSRAPPFNLLQLAKASGYEQPEGRVSRKARLTGIVSHLMEVGRLFPEPYEFLNRVGGARTSLGRRLKRITSTVLGIEYTFLTKVVPKGAENVVYVPSHPDDPDVGTAHQKKRRSELEKDRSNGYKQRNTEPMKRREGDGSTSDHYSSMEAKRQMGQRQNRRHQYFSLLDGARALSSFLIHAGGAAVAVAAASSALEVASRVLPDGACRIVVGPAIEEAVKLIPCAGPIIGFMEDAGIFAQTQRASLTHTLAHAIVNPALLSRGFKMTKMKSWIITTLIHAAANAIIFWLNRQLERQHAASENDALPAQQGPSAHRTKKATSLPLPLPTHSSSTSGADSDDNSATSSSATISSCESAQGAWKAGKPGSLRPSAMAASAKEHRVHFESSTSPSSSSDSEKTILPQRLREMRLPPGPQRRTGSPPLAARARPCHCINTTCDDCMMSGRASFCLLDVPETQQREEDELSDAGTEVKKSAPEAPPGPAPTSILQQQPPRAAHLGPEEATQGAHSLSYLLEWLGFHSCPKSQPGSGNSLKHCAQQVRHHSPPNEEDLPPLLVDYYRTKHITQRCEDLHQIMKNCNHHPISPLTIHEAHQFEKLKKFVRAARRGEIFNKQHRFPVMHQLLDEAMAYFQKFQVNLETCSDDAASSVDSCITRCHALPLAARTLRPLNATPPAPPNSPPAPGPLQAEPIHSFFLPSSRGLISLALVCGGLLVGAGIFIKRKVAQLLSNTFGDLEHFLIDHTQHRANALLMYGADLSAVPAAPIFVNAFQNRALFRRFSFANGPPAVMVVSSVDAEGQIRRPATPTDPADTIVFGAKEILLGNTLRVDTLSSFQDFAAVGLSFQSAANARRDAADLTASGTRSEMSLTSWRLHPLSVQLATLHTGPFRAMQDPCTTQLVSHLQFGNQSNLANINPGSQMFYASHEFNTILQQTSNHLNSRAAISTSMATTAAFTNPKRLLKSLLSIAGIAASPQNAYMSLQYIAQQFELTAQPLSMLLLTQLIPAINCTLFGAALLSTCHSSVRACMPSCGNLGNWSLPPLPLLSLDWIHSPLLIFYSIHPKPAPTKTCSTERTCLSCASRSPSCLSSTLSSLNRTGPQKIPEIFKDLTKFLSHISSLLLTQWTRISSAIHTSLNVLLSTIALSTCSTASARAPLQLAITLPSKQPTTDTSSTSSKTSSDTCGNATAKEMLSNDRTSKRSAIRTNAKTSHSQPRSKNDSAAASHGPPPSTASSTSSSLPSAPSTGQTKRRKKFSGSSTTSQ